MPDYKSLLGTLENKLEKIKKVFDIEDILGLKPNQQYIQRYYKINKLAYSLFHTQSDRMYVGISRDGIFKETDLLEAARCAEKYIRELNAKNVLELATGRGATSSYLAKKYPAVTFDGIDLSPGQLGYALKKAKSIKNYHPVQGDYHDLSRFKENQFAVAFVIEALCYSERKEVVFSEVHRVLRDGGVFIILDGCLRRKKSSFTAVENLAENLFERGLALSHGEEHDSFLRKAQQSGLEVLSSEDVSSFIMPTLAKFENLASKFFNHPLLARIAYKILPYEFLYNAVSGFLWPELVKLGIQGYCITVLRKV